MKTTIKIKNMKCVGCEKRIINALSTEESISKVKADHKKGIVEITSKQSLDLKKVKEILENLEFEIEE